MMATMAPPSDDVEFEHLAMGLARLLLEWWQRGRQQTATQGRGIACEASLQAVVRGESHFEPQRVELA
jgi:hypothetical protein